MSFIIDPANPIPIYRQIVDQVIYRIASRELSDGDQLPSIRFLSTNLRINPNTVIKAYRELELLGFASSHHGKGYFVAAGGVDPARTEWRRQVLEDLRQAVNRAVEMGIPAARLRQVVEEALAGDRAQEKAPPAAQRSGSQGFDSSAKRTIGKGDSR